MGKSRKNKAKGLLWFLILLLSALGLLVGAAWVQSMTAEKKALQEELAKYRTIIFEGCLPCKKPGGVTDTGKPVA